MMRSIIFFGLIALVCFINYSDATYKKLPFNGSIFGKRTSYVEYDTNERAVFALCEIASETCRALYQTMENK
ncbi:unnamed protein product [Colias eurytheme]|nr:unnamed protein product [Colias eurytheme]